MKSQLLPEHVSVAFAGVAQAAQSPPHNRKPGLQVRPQVALLQVETPASLRGQTSHRVPQLVGALFDTQTWPQACWADGQVQTPAAHEAPCGQSLVRRHPVWQVREVGLQK